MGNPLYPSSGSSSSKHTSSSSSSATSSFPGLRGGSFTASSSKLAKPANDYDPSFHPGLLNLGNTCFLNSVLQAIANTRDFRLLIQGPPVPATFADESSAATTSALVPARHNQWPNRAQSPALRVSDGEHGRRIDHPVNPSGSLDSSLASLSTLSAHDPVATIKPGKLPTAAVAAAPIEQKSYAPTSSTKSTYEPDVLDLPLNTAFRHVLEKFWVDGHKSRTSVNVNPKRLLNQIGKKYDQYLEYGQQDGHELMRHLLDACRMEELDLIKKMQPPPAKKKAKTDGTSATASSAAATTTADTTIPHLNRLTAADVENGQVVSHSPESVAADAPQSAPTSTEEQLLPFLDLLFCGKLASMVVCEGCKKVSHTYEDFYDISLSLRDDASNPKSRKRDRLRSMADRWRRATQGRTIMDRKSAAAATAAAAGSASNTPVGTPRYSETEASDADSSAVKPKKSAGLLSPDEGSRGRFQLRSRSLRKSSGRHEKLGATSGSEMEPDFPDMASLSLAPTSASRPYIDSAPASAGEDSGDTRTGTRVARMLGSTATGTAAVDGSSRETSPHPPVGDRSAVPPHDSGMRPPLRATKSSSHQSAYIARIMADDPASSHANPAAPRKAGAPSPLFDAVATAAAAQGKPLHGFFRSVGAGARHRDPAAEFEPNPRSRGAKRRLKIREEQSTTGLIASLRQFTSVEVLDGDNSFACKNCWRLANPPDVQEREQIRRRRRRRGVATTEVDDEEGSEPSSSDGDSDGDKGKDKRDQIGEPTTVGDDTVTSRSIGNGMSTTASQSTLASSSVDSIMTGSSASHPSLHRSDIPTISMTSADASVDDIEPKVQRSYSGSIGGGSIVARDYAGSASASPASDGGASSSNGQVMQQKRGSESSLSSVDGAGRNRDRLAPTNGYDTGTETDMSGFSTGMDESNASTGEGTDTEAEGDGAKSSTTVERSGPKRSAQSLPRRALKRYLIASAPPVLIFHLKRFQATGRGFVSGLAGFKKIDDQVTFPEYLDITPWLAPPREEYDRRGRLKASSDPLAIRKRAEEEAVRAGVDARHVKVEMSHARSRGHRKLLHGDKRGKKHGMWSWHLSDHRAAVQGGRVAAGGGGGGGGGDLDEGPKVHSANGHEIVPSVIRRPKTEYRLYAVIVHQGSLSAGHYTAYVLSDRIKLKDGPKEMVARSAPTSRSNTPAPLSVNATTATSGGGGGFGQFFKPSRSNAASPAPLPVPIRPASAAPLSSSVAMTSVASSSSVSGSSSHDIAPQTSISSLETDSSQRSATGTPASESGSSCSQQGPKLVRPQPQLKAMASWDSLDELEQSHANTNGSVASAIEAAPGNATPTASGTMTPLEPTPAVATVASHNSNAHRHVEESSAVGQGEEDDDDVDPRRKDDGRRWVYTSDTIVRAATIDEVLKAKAYMLFYERL